MMSPQKLLRRERTLKLLAVLTILAAGFVVILAVDNMLVSFVLAFVINYLLAPMVNFFERQGISRNLAILVPFTATGIIIGIAIYLLLPLISAQVTSLAADFPKYQQDTIELLAKSESKFKGFFNLQSTHLTQDLNSWLLAKTTELSTTLPLVVSKSLTVMMLAPFLAFFMLKDGRKASRTVLDLVPNNLFELAIYLYHRINEQMGGFIRARLAEAAIVGLVVWAALQILGFPYAPLLALFAALTNLIPYIGPIIGAIPAIIIALVSKDASIVEPMSLNLFVVTSIYFFAQLIDIVFIIPLVVARIVNLHPVTVVIVIIIGAQLMGILGMVISIPVASVVKLTVTSIYDHLMEFRS